MKTLIAWFSWSGNTEAIARRIQRRTRGTLQRIERETPYSTDYHTCAYVEAKEEADQRLRPPIRGPLPELSDYESVILACPVWWYTLPAPVMTFLESYPDWGGKKLYIFANAYSSIPGQFTNCLRDAMACAKGAKVLPGLYNNEIEKLASWARKNGF